MVGAISANERELVQQLLDDVEILRAHFVVGIPKPSATRVVFSPVLRRWIAEGLIHQVQKLIRPETLLFETFNSGPDVKLCKAGIYEHWMGMVLFDTLGISTGRLTEGYRGPNAKAVHRGNERPDKPIPRRASNFIDQRMFFWKERFYTRQDIIKMHANMLGGVHFDFRRADDEAHIKEIKNYFGFEMKGNNYQMLVGNEIEVARSDVARRAKVYDATELIVMDSARIFAKGVDGSEKLLSKLLS